MEAGAGPDRGPMRALHWRVPCAISTPPREAALAPVPAGGWCNGNTAVFGTVILGSSPSPPATEFLQEFTLTKGRRHFAGDMLAPPFRRVAKSAPGPKMT